MNCRLVYSLVAGAAAIAADMLYILIADPVDAAIAQPQRAFQVELIYADRTKVAHGQAGTL